MIDSGYQQAVQIIFSSRSLGVRPGRSTPSPAVDETTLQVLAAADALEFSQAHALWLVDVCDHSYAEAAAIVGVAKPEFADTVATARREIASKLTKN